METTKRESSTSADVSGRPSLEELMDSYTVPENEFRLGHPVQILACCWRELLGEFLGKIHITDLSTFTLHHFTFSSVHSTLSLNLTTSLTSPLASLFLVFAGTSSVIILNSVSSEDKTINGTTILGVSLCFGLVVATMVYALASISRAFFLFLKMAIFVGF